MSLPLSSVDPQAAAGRVADALEVRRTTRAAQGLPEHDTIISWTLDGRAYPLSEADLLALIAGVMGDE